MEVNVQTIALNVLADAVNHNKERNKRNPVWEERRVPIIIQIQHDHLCKNSYGI